MRRIGLKPEIVGSAGYNASPEPLEIAGVRASHPRLFDALEETGDGPARAQAFHAYMKAVFGSADNLPGKPLFQRYLLGWMLDSNSPEGAVLKGWAHSRFGLPPTWHRGSLAANPSASVDFERELREGLGNHPGVLEQFDLVYEFVQHELSRLPFKHMVLYRGTGHLTDERGRMTKVGGALRVRLNCLNSFTREFERAWEFGDRVIEARVPLTKVFFDDTIFRTGILTGEEEVMVVGGEYEVRLRW